MSTTWRKVDAKCMVCREPVGKISVKNGKIIVDEYRPNWGQWHKVPEKSEMQVICRDCEKRITKQRNKQSRSATERPA